MRRLLEWDRRLAIVHEFHEYFVNVALNFVACARLICCGKMYDEQIVSLLCIWWVIAQRKCWLLRSRFYVRRQPIVNNNFTNDFHCAETWCRHKFTENVSIVVRDSGRADFYRTFVYSFASRDDWKLSCQKYLFAARMFLPPIFIDDISTFRFAAAPNSNSVFLHESFSI